MKKVLQIAFNDLGHGGIQGIIMTIAGCIAPYAEQDIILFSTKQGHYDKEFENYGNIYRCPHYEGNSSIIRNIDKYTWYNRTKNSVKKIIKDNGGYDVVHSHSFFEAGPCMQAAYECGVPIRITHSHNTGFFGKKKPSLKNQLEKAYRSFYREKIIKYSTDMIGCSRLAADYLFGKGEGKVLLNCIDLDRFDNSGQRCKNESLNIVHVGNFSYQKNQLFLVEIFKKIKELKPDSKLTMVGGDSDYKKSVVKMVEDAKLQSSVCFMPHDSNVPQILSENDIFLFPSNFEGLPLALVEAQAAGLHCFTSENVTREVDCGLVSFLDLNSGAENWAKEILKNYNRIDNTKPADIERFSKEVFRRHIFDLYKIEGD